MHCVHDEPIYIPLNPIPQNGEVAFALASVCTEWRAVALGLAPLWANLLLAPSVPESSVIRILQRSRGHTLNIQLVQGSVPAALIEESSRWASLSGHIEQFEEYPADFDSLQGRLSSLHTLELETGLAVEDLRTMAPITAFVNAPALRRVTMVGLCPQRLHIPWHQITTLDCRGFFDLLGLYNTLRATPNLQNLVVSVVPFDDNHARPESLTLAHLHMLHIQNRASSNADKTWTQELTAPSLTHLRLEDCNADEDLSISDFIGRSQCVLKSLHVANISSVEAAKSFLRSLPTSLEELRMYGLSHRSAHDIAFDILSKKRSGVCMPSLRRLHLSMSDPSPVAPLWDFLDKVPRAPSPRRPQDLAEVRLYMGYDVRSFVASRELGKLAAAGTSGCEFSILDHWNRDLNILSKTQQPPTGSLADPDEF